MQLRGYGIQYGYACWFHMYPVGRNQASFDHSVSLWLVKIKLLCGPSTSGEYWRVEDIKLHLFLPAIGLLVYPAVAFIRGPLRRIRRGRAGLCLACGQNLVENASAFCPECGVRREDRQGVVDEKATR